MATEIELKLTEINSVRNPKIGLRIGKENVCPDGVGHYQHYQTGESIYWHPATGAHLIYGLIKNKWANLGWEGSTLGYPTSDETDTGSGPGRYNNFQNGIIIWKSGVKEAFALYEYIYHQWAKQGYDTGHLGFPVSDQYLFKDSLGFMRHQNFENGEIYDPVLLAGSFIKSALHNEIYKLDNNKRRWIPDAPTLLSMTTWDKVIVLSDIEVSAIPLGDNLPSVIIVDSSIYSSTPTKNIILSDGGKINVKLIRNPPGSSLAINKILTESLPTEKKDGWTTEIKKVYLTADSTTFMSASANNTINIVPGAIYSFEDFIGGANNEILGNRNPIRIYTDNAVRPGAIGGIIVNNPSSYEILQGNLGSNLNVIKNSIVESPSGVRLLSQSFTCNSEAELMIKITAGGSYGGFTGSAGYTHNQNETHFYLTVDAVKLMYTIKAEKPESGLFVNANTIPNKVYVKEVNYGTRILANVEIVLENREDIINFKASYEGGFKANLGLDFISKNKTKNEKANAYLIGAPMTVTLLNKDNLEADITTLLSTCGFRDAVPISYTLGDMDGNTIATHSTTDEVIERNSVPDNLVYHLDEATIEIKTGDDNKEWQSQVAIELYSGNAPDGHILMYQPVKNSKIEFPINIPTSVGLQLHPDTNTDDLLLDNIKNAGGLRVRIFYSANLFTDAWRINGVSLKLRFIDQNGIVYPTSADTIPLDGKAALDCANAVQTMDGFDRNTMECFFNRNFTATTSTVSKN